MILVPPGAQLAPVDLPPPPPQSDPREPSPHVNTRQRIATPSRPRSPVGSRGSSPVRPPTQRSPSSDPTALPLVQPVPHNLSPSSSAVPILPALHHSHPHLSRPSSPSSVTSSTSAIFERDIEHPAVPSLSLNPNPIQTHQLNHKSSRLQHLSHAHGSPLDHTVPAVLDDAVEALTESGTSRGLEGLEIEFPASAVPFTSSRKASTGPQGFMLNSRSSSPVSGASISPAQSPPILNQLWTRTIVPPTGDHSSGGNSPTSMMGGNVPRPSMANREPTGPQLPGGWAFGDGAGGAGDTITTPMAENVPTPPAQSGSASPAVPTHLSPAKDKRRISFISYNDLLLSIPTTVTPLGDITSGTMSPDHLPGTISPNMSIRSPVVPPPVPAGPASLSPVEHKSSSSWDSGAAGRGSGLGLGEGEWERQGLGRGLEQRLEDLVHVQGKSGEGGR